MIAFLLDSMRGRGRRRQGLAECVLGSAVCKVSAPPSSGAVRGKNSDRGVTGQGYPTAIDPLEVVR